VGSVEVELGLVALAAMLSPTTLTFSVLALVLGDRPLRTGLWFFAGAFGVTLVIGVVAAFVIGDVAAPSNPSMPKTWVSVVDVVAGAWLLVFVVSRLRRPADPSRMQSMIAQMSRVSSSPAVAIIAAGATLANPGGFIPLALKEISQLNPSTSEYALLWLAFAVISLLPLLVAVVLLALAPERANAVLASARGWIERHARTLAAVILLLLAAALLRNGIVGLTA
jgi:hypothetical protein